MIDTVNEDDAALEIEALELLKSQAKTLGIKFHPNIGADTLAKKIAEASASDKPKEKEAPSKSKLALAKESALKLVRVRITNMNPNKRNYDSETFCAGNSAVGTVKRCIPFEKEWHVPQIILNQIREAKYQSTSSIKNPDGTGIQARHALNSYSIEVLPDLDVDELQKLKQRQLMAAGKANV